jgi:hypothetical protein
LLTAIHPEEDDALDDSSQNSSEHEARRMLLQKGRTTKATEALGYVKMKIEANRQPDSEELLLKEEWSNQGPAGSHRPEIEEWACRSAPGGMCRAAVMVSILTAVACLLLLGQRLHQGHLARNWRTLGVGDHAVHAASYNEDKFEITTWPVMATADKVGGWEVFRISTHRDGTISLRTIHDKYFTAYKNGALTADSDTVGEKQVFKRHNNSDGTISLETFRGTYVSTKWDGTLRSDGNASIQGSERFEEETHSDGSVSLKTARGKYVTAVLEPKAVCRAQGQMFPVLAMSDAVGVWETFHAVTHRDGSVSFKTCHGTYLTVQDDGSLSGNCDTIAVQQKFRKHTNPDGTISLRTYLGSYITAKEDGTFVAEEARGPTDSSPSDGAVVRTQQSFRTEKLPDDGVALRSQGGGGLYLSAVRVPRDTEGFCPHQAARYPVLAASPQVGGWEAFKLIENEDSTVSLHTFHGKYVTAQANGTVSGQCDTVAAQQSFRLFHVDESGTVALRAYTGKYVTAHEGGVLLADGNVLGEDQEFTLKHYGDGKVSLQSRKGMYFTAGLKTHINADSGPIHRVGASGGSDDECNTTLYAPRIRKPQIWDVSEELNNRCFDMLSEQLPEMTRGGKLGRNWCWVGLKESGCQVDGHLRNWHEMRMQAAAVNLTPMPPKNHKEFEPLTQPELCDRRELGKAEWSRTELGRARAWFSATVGVQVLSVAEDKETRLKVTAARLDDLGIEFSVVEGIDLRWPGAVSQARQEGLLPADFNVTRAQAVALGPRNDVGRYERGGIGGTLGSFLGHLRAQTKAFESTPQKPLTVILEDDAYLSDDFVPQLWRLVTRELPCDWQVVSLNSRCPVGFCVSQHLVRVQPDPNEPDWRCHHGVNRGFSGVLYRTIELRHVQERWRRLAFDEERPRCLEVDTSMAALSDDVAFYAVPGSQVPGLLHERWLGTPTRLEVNRAKQYEVEWT